MPTFAAAAISTTPNTTLTKSTGAKPTARPPRAAPMREPADMAETMRFGPRPVSIAPRRQYCNSPLARTQTDMGVADDEDSRDDLAPTDRHPPSPSPRDRALHRANAPPARPTTPVI